MKSRNDGLTDPVMQAVGAFAAGARVLAVCIRNLAVRSAAATLAAGIIATTASAHPGTDSAGRIAIVSAFAPELEILKAGTRDKTVRMINGVEFVTGSLENREVVLFLSGISVVNAAMTVQLALERFHINAIIFSGIAGGVDPDFNIGDVVIAGRWGQYLESVFARRVGHEWETIPFFEYPYANYGMMFPRSVTVSRKGSTKPETRFWFPVDETLLADAGRAAAGVTLEQCVEEGRCLEHEPRVAVGGSGVSGSAFVDNARFRDYTFRTFGARVLDMESAAVAHVAWSNDVPFIAVRSLADLAGGSGQANQMEIFLGLAANNAATVVRALLRETGDR